MFGVVLLSGFANSQDLKFPRQLTSEGNILTVYQPQVEKWQDHKNIEYRNAFSLKPAKGKEVVGVMYMTAATDVDIESHRVLIDKMLITTVHFPSLSEDSSAIMEKAVRAFLTPDRSLVMSVEQIVACTPKTDSIKSINVNNEPPIIFVSKKPTLLLQIEGAPIKAAASKEEIEYVINANYPLFFDKASKLYYLYDGLEWRKGSEVNGSWAFTSSLPKSLINLTKDSNWVYLKSIIPAVATASKKMPEVYYAEQPAELIMFEGEPVYKAVSGTTLKYATNTESDIFLCGADKQYYYLSSGRWFSAPGLSGPWTFASPNLPKDFSKIPLNSPVAGILSYVPGTDQAKDAAMIAQIPVTAKVNAEQAAKAVNIVYQGEPQFKKIDSTNLYYAVNTADKVIRVSDAEYYACVNAVWFVSSSPKGPWKTANTIPASIYAMPPSSPVYNVTYVTQTVVSTTYVQSSYTSGYMGVYVAPTPYGVVIVSGTGYYHPPYYYYPPYGYPVCYHYYPMTYGCYAYKPYPYGGTVYRAGYNPYTGTYGRSATAYGPYGSATVAQAYNPYTGTYARGASVSTPYGSRSAAQAYNPYTGAGAATRQGSSPYGQWGSSVVTDGSGNWAQTAHSSNSQGTVAGARTSEGGKAIAASGDNGSGGVAKTGSGDVYAAKDGNVYKKTDDGWSSYNNGEWSSANKPTQNSATAQTQAANAQTKATTAQTQAATAQTKATTAQSQATGAKTGTSTQPAGANTQARQTGSGTFNSQQMNQEYQNRQSGNAQMQQFNNRSASANRSFSGSRPSGGGRRR